MTEVYQKLKYNYMQEEFSELIKYLDKKFQNTATKEDVSALAANIGVDLTNIKEDLREARRERQGLESRINETYVAVDGFIKVVDKLETEFVVIKEDLKRVKEVIKEKLGVDLF